MSLNFPVERFEIGVWIYPRRFLGSINKFINTAATQAQLLRQSRLSTLVVGGISIGVAIIFQDVFGLMIYMFSSSRVTSNSSRGSWAARYTFPSPMETYRWASILLFPVCGH